MENAFKKDPPPGANSLPALEPTEPVLPPAAQSVAKAAQSTSSSRLKVGSEYTITLDKTSGERLGINVDNLDGMTLLIESVNAGLVQNWNRQNPDKEVRPGDRVVEVNGIRDKLVELVDECKKDQILTIKLVVGNDQ